MRLLLGLFTFGLLAGDRQCLASIGGGCPASIGGGCPPSWGKWGDHCYKVTDKALPWSKAKQECIRLGSVMAVPQSNEEIEHLKFSQLFWIDCSNIEGTWVVGEGTTNGTWGSDEPSGSGNCAIMKLTKNWNDVNCTEMFHAICKKTEPFLHF